jgi:hypothetical protein
MKTLQDLFENAYNEARSLPTHVDSMLQERYKFYNEKHKQGFTSIYSPTADAVSVFKALKRKYYSAEKYYIKTIKTYRENGSLKKYNDWEKKLMYHKAYSRQDVEVKSVEFDIVGVKRATNSLPSAVLLTNIRFIVG